MHIPVSLSKFNFCDETLKRASYQRHKTGVNALKS